MSNPFDHFVTPFDCPNRDNDGYGCGDFNPHPEIYVRSNLDAETPTYNRRSICVLAIKKPHYLFTSCLSYGMKSYQP